MKKVVLIGYMGSGKSAVAKKIAKDLIFIIYNFICRLFIFPWMSGEHLEEAF